MKPYINLYCGAQVNMKVLIIGGAFNKGGVESVIMPILRLNSTEITFDVLATRVYEGYYDSELSGLGINVIKTKPISEQGVFAFMLFLYKLFVRNNYDIVHINGVLSSATSALVAKISGVDKVIFHAHNTQDQGIQKIKSNLLRSLVSFALRKVIDFSSTEKLACGKAAAEFVFGKNIDDVTIIRNGVDEQIFNLVESHRQEKYCDLSTLCIGNAARFTNVKNQKFAIEIAKILKEQDVDFKLIFAGEGEELNNCKCLVDKYLLSENVVFLNNVANMEVFYKNIDVFILPSLFEGFPVSIIEAQLSGVPVLMSDIIDKEADFQLGIANFLSLNNVEQWVDYVKKGKDKRITLGSISDKYLEVSNNYSLSKNINKVIEIYRK